MHVLKGSIFLTLLLMVISVTATNSLFAGSGGSIPPGDKPPVKLLPDLKPTGLFFNKKCHLMAKVKNAGKAKFVGAIPCTLEVDGQKNLTSCHIGHSQDLVMLFPGSTVTKKALDDALAVWDRKKIHEFKIILDNDNKIAESNSKNNSITKNLLCPKYMKIKPQKKFKAVQ